MKHVIEALMLSAVLILAGCSGNNADELYDTAQFEERQHNVAHAKQLYEEIIKKYPGRELEKKAQERLRQLAQSQ